MMSNLDLIRWKLDETSDELLLMSRRHCHAGHVSSLVFDRSEHGLLRVFLCWPDHQLWKNEPVSQEWTVGVHDHRYDLTIHWLAGDVFNLMFDKHGSINTTEYQFESGVMNGQPAMTKVGPQLLRCYSEEKVKGPITLWSDDLHTMTVPRYRPAAWLVYEGLTRKTVTSLFTNTKPSLAGLYEPFASTDEVRVHFEEFCSLNLSEEFYGHHCW